MRHHGRTVRGIVATCGEEDTIGVPGRVSPAYAAERRAIEFRHAANDDGTTTLYAHAAHGMEHYAEPDGPVTDDSPVVRLMEFGLPTREAETLYRNDCLTIGYARRLVQHHVIQGWTMCGPVTEAKVAKAIRKMDEARRTR